MEEVALALESVESTITRDLSSLRSSTCLEWVGLDGEVDKFYGNKLPTYHWVNTRRRSYFGFTL